MAAIWTWQWTVSLRWTVRGRQFSPHKECSSEHLPTHPFMTTCGNSRMQDRPLAATWWVCWHLYNTVFLLLTFLVTLRINSLAPRFSKAEGCMKPLPLSISLMTSPLDQGGHGWSLWHHGCVCAGEGGGQDTPCDWPTRASGNRTGCPSETRHMFEMAGVLVVSQPGVSPAELGQWAGRGCWHFKSHDLIFRKWQ